MNIDFSDYTPPPILDVFDRYSNRSKLPDNDWNIDRHKHAIDSHSALKDRVWSSARFLFVDDELLFETGWDYQQHNGEQSLSRVSRHYERHLYHSRMLGEALGRTSKFSSHLSDNQILHLANVLARLFTFSDSFLSLPSFSNCLDDARFLLRLASQDVDKAKYFSPLFYEKYNGLAVCFPSFRRGLNRVKIEGRVNVKDDRHDFLQFESRWPKELLETAILRRVSHDFRNVKTIKNPGFGRYWFVEVLASFWTDIKGVNKLKKKSLNKQKYRKLPSREEDKPLTGSQLRSSFRAAVREALVIFGDLSESPSFQNQKIQQIFAPRSPNEHNQFCWNDYADKNSHKLINQIRSVDNTITSELFR